MYLAALVLTTIGLLCFALTREPRAPWSTPSRGSLETLRRIPGVLGGDPSFASYCLCRALGAAALMSTPFFTLYAQESLALNGVALGRLSALFFVAQTATNPLWGRLADREGFRSVALIAGTLWMAAAAVLLALPHTLSAVGLVFTLVGAGQGGFRMATVNLVFEFGLDAEFAQRMATVNMIAELAPAVAPLGAGILADHRGYAAVLLLSLGLMTVAQTIMACGVRVTRRHRTGRLS
jgi:MFS family permease